MAELINFIQASENKYFDPRKGRTIEHSSVQVFAKELVILLGQKDMKKIGHLTDWFDSPSYWKNSTKTAGKNDIHGMCVNILGATAPDWIPIMLPPEAMGGGFTSRVIFVVEQHKSKIIPEPIYNDAHRKMKDALINDLMIIAAANFCGPFTFTREAQERYNQFYIEQEKAIKEDIYPIRDKTFSGYVNRRALHLRKLSIAFAASRGNVMEGKIEIEDFERSLAVLQNAERKMPRLFGGVGRSNNGVAVHAVMSFMINRGDSSRAEILQQFSHDIDSQSITIVEETLQYMGFMKVAMEQNGNVRYVLNNDYEG